MSSSVPGIKAYLFGTAFPALFPDTQITYGMPGSFEGQDVVTVGNARVVNDVPVMSNARRVEEVIELQVLLSCYRPGGPEAQQQATEAVYGLYSTLRDYFRTAPNETLGGNCRESRVTSHDLIEDDDEDDITNGRLSQIEAVITIRARQ